MDGEKLQSDFRVQIALPSSKDKQKPPRNTIQTSHEKSKYNACDGRITIYNIVLTC